MNRPLLLMVVIIWIALTAAVTAQDPRQPTDISVIEWSPSDQLIAFGTMGGDVSVMNTSGQVIQHIAAHSDRILSIEFNSNETEILTSSDDGNIKLWSIYSGNLLQTYSGHNESVYKAIFTPDEQQVISVGSLAVQDNTRIWNTTTGAQVNSTENPGGIVDLIYSPDQSRIFAPGFAHFVGFLSPSTFETVEFIDLVDSINVARWSPNGQQYIVGFENGDVNLYDSSAHTLVHTFLGSDSVDYNIFYRSNIWDVAFNSDGTEVASVGFDGTLRRWDLATEALIVDTQIAATVFEAKFDSTASQLAYTELGQTTPTVIDAIPPVIRPSLVDQPVAGAVLPAYINDVNWSPNADYIGVATSDGVYILSNKLQEVTHIAQGSFIYSLTWKPDGSQLVFTNGTAIDVWDWQATAKTITHSTSFGSGSNKRFALKWSPDGTALASLVVELPYNPLSEVGLATIEVWNTENWLLDFAVSEKFLVDTQFTINSLLDWNPNGQPLVLFAGNQARLQDDDIFIETPVTAFVIDLNTQTTIQSMPLSGSDAYSVAWQPNGDLIAVGTDAFVSLYNLSAQQFIRSHPIGYDIRALDWSPDGRYVMGDTAVIDAISQEVLGYFAVSGELVSTQWSPDGLHILTAAVDGALRVEDPYLIPDFVPADDLEDMAPGP